MSVTPTPGPSILFDFFAASQRVKLLLTDAMADAGLRPDEYAVYSVLVDDGPSTPSRMADRVGMPPTTMSHYVRSLLERGHARRSRHPRDGRSTVLALTPAGKAAHRRAAAAFEEANRRFLAALSEPEGVTRRVLAAVGDATDVAHGDLARASTQRTA